MHIILWHRLYVFNRLKPNWYNILNAYFVSPQSMYKIKHLIFILQKNIWKGKNQVKELLVWSELRLLRFEVYLPSQPPTCWPPMKTFATIHNPEIFARAAWIPNMSSKDAPQVERNYWSCMQNSLWNIIRDKLSAKMHQWVEITIHQGKMIWSEVKV